MQSRDSGHATLRPILFLLDQPSDRWAVRRTAQLRKGLQDVPIGAQERERGRSAFTASMNASW